LIFETKIIKKKKRQLKIKFKNMYKDINKLLIFKSFFKNNLIFLQALFLKVTSPIFVVVGVGIFEILFKKLFKRIILLKNKYLCGVFELNFVLNELLEFI